MLLRVQSGMAGDPQATRAAIGLALKARPLDERDRVGLRDSHFTREPVCRSTPAYPFPDALVLYLQVVRERRGDVGVRMGVEIADAASWHSCAAKNKGCLPGDFLLRTYELFRKRNASHGYQIRFRGNQRERSRAECGVYSLGAAGT